MSANAPFFFRMWGIPFVAVGLYMVFGRFFADAKQRSKTYYGVTSERVIIVSGLREPEMVAILLDRLNTPQLRVQKIHHHIELRAPSDQIYQPSYLPFTNPSVPPDWIGRECYRLFALEDARRVCDLILESARKLE